MTDYEPGTFVRADTPRAGDVLLALSDRGIWRTVNTGDLYGSRQLTNVRRLVVIDPDDTKQVTALLHGFYGSPVPYIEDVESMQAALRSLLPTPKPPKPAEPTGLGAVVETLEGTRWVLYTRRDSLDPWFDGIDSASYAALDVVRVLSEGVTATSTAPPRSRSRSAATSTASPSSTDPTGSAPSSFAAEEHA